MDTPGVGLWIIGLTGFAGCGKSTISNHMIRHYGFTRASFADPLKDLVAREFGLDREKLNDLDYKNTRTKWNGRTVREILQIIGTEGFRAVDPDYWVKKGVQHVMKLHGHLLAHDPHHVPRFVFDDVRFSNEAVAIIEELGGELWGIIRQDENGKMQLPESHHSSETAIWSCLERADHTLSAKDGDLEGLLRQATVLLAQQ